MKQIQVTLTQLEAIIEEAKKVKRTDNSASNTIVITQLSERDSHLGGDKIEAELKCNYAECFGTKIY